MTRAKQSLMLSRAVYRRSYGEERLRASLPSRFLAEIPGDLIEAALGSQSDPGETRRYEPDPDFSRRLCLSPEAPHSLRPTRRSLSPRRTERSPDRHTRPPRQVRRRHNHRCRRRRRRAPADRQLPGLRREETRRALRELAARMKWNFRYSRSRSELHKPALLHPVCCTMKPVLARP